MVHEHIARWEFINEKGDFRLENPHHTSYLYFPLVNEAGLMSCVTPTLHGDIKTGQNNFLTRPVSVEDLHETRSARNFWLASPDEDPWSATGNSAAQNTNRYRAGADRVTLEAGLLWHTLTRENLQLGLRATITNFVPAANHQVELMRVTITNTGSEARRITPIAAIPIFGRSADNLRDHRHVTSLLHRIHCQKYGVLVHPTLSFDERGHTENKTTYAVLGMDAGGAPPTGFYPLTEDFIGEGGSLDWPEAVVQPQSYHAVGEGATFDGYEAMGGLLFQGIDLQPGESHTYILLLSILSDGRLPETLIEAYGSGEKFNVELEKTCQMWEAKRSRLSVHTGDSDFDRWMNWVAVQPTLRRLFGNSFLPYHDYGRGGRGWRDLWQDILALLIQEPGDVSTQLWGYFAGVRMDGSNATIIGSEPGEFSADRNNIPRVWMDHGAWPLLTTKLYLDLTGDLGFLLRKQTYFKDHLADRVKTLDESWQPEQGMQLRDQTGQVYLGTVLEHLLVQNLVPFFNVGEHNLIRLEDADWNDGLDLAPDRGESVAFSAFYAGNLEQLSGLVLALEKLSITHVEVGAELGLLLDTFGDPVDYGAISGKQARLAQFFDNCRSKVSGKTIPVPLRDLAADLQKKAAWLAQHIRSQEWVENAAGFSWFNGYYDNDGRRVEGDHKRGTRMTLTGQVFTLMGKVATDGQAREMIRAADRYLLDPQIGGYRLNTDFGEVLLKLGRAFGFAFGHKENGAMFSHMAVMYANALYQRGFVQEGYQVLEGIYRQSTDFKVSRMYPGIPEYFNIRGRGMYPYLTGSASWYLLTLVTEVFGVKGRLGDLELSPKLMGSQFDPQGKTSVTTVFADRRLKITYLNSEQLDFGDYQVGAIEIDRQPQAYEQMGAGAILPRQLIVNAPGKETTHITVTLVRK